MTVKLLAICLLPRSWTFGTPRAVVKKVMNERFRALAPAFGIDVPVVTMWAIKALRARAQRDPEPFSSQNLHTAPAEALDHESGLAKNLHNIRVYERLFVNGLHIQKNRQLLPDPLCAPPTSVNKGLLSAAALHPSPEARTYVCVEMPGWQGQLVVTLFIRAVNAGGSLYVESTFRVLPPLKAKFLWIDRFDGTDRPAPVAAFARCRDIDNGSRITRFFAILGDKDVPSAASRTSSSIAAAQRH